MPDSLTLLQGLASVAIDGAVTRESLVRVADLIRDAVGVSQAFIVNAEETDFRVCGDSKSGDAIGTNQMGLWLVQHQMEITGRPVAFDIRERRVSDIVPVEESRAYLGFALDGSDNSGQMLILKCAERCAPTPDLFAFIEAAAPAVALILDRVLSSVRANRQREQMMALANASELLIQAEHIGPVLQDLATAISSASSYDLVSIDVYDSESKTFSISALNRAPQVQTSLGALWKRQEYDLYPEAIIKNAISRHEPLIVPDLQNDERIPEYGREFFKRAHIYSAAQFPITFHDQFQGMLRVASQRPRGFSPEEVGVLNGFAAQLAVSLKALEMYKSLAESERQLKAYAEELQASMEAQHHLARTDALTGIPNRRYVDEVIRGECSRALRHEKPLCVALADIDRFKDVNDAFGHKAGDEALVQLGDLARRSCRRGDVVGRYGGDEFLFVLPEADLAAATRFASRFRLAVAQHVFALSPNESTRMTLSLGVAEFNRKSTRRPSSLLKEADDALYRAKAKGGNKTCSSGSARKAA